jgi:hypothetical protein
VGYPGNPGPTRNRALAHQGETDLFAASKQKYYTRPRTHSFIATRVGFSQLAMTVEDAQDGASRRAEARFPEGEVPEPIGLMESVVW